MTDTPTIAEALKLAEQGGPQWDALLARMQYPKPWRHNIVGDEALVPTCLSCKRQWSHLLLSDAQERAEQEHWECDKPPDSVTEPLPCIVEKAELRVWGVRGICSDAIEEAIRTVLRISYPDYHQTDAVSVWKWYALYPPRPTALKLICLWVAEGLLPEQQEGPE